MLGNVSSAAWHFATASRTTQTRKVGGLARRLGQICPDCSCSPANGIHVPNADALSAGRCHNVVTTESEREALAGDTFPLCQPGLRHVPPDS